jgi:transcriptional regulator of PTS gene
MLSNIENIHRISKYRIKDREKASIFQYICSQPSPTRKKTAAYLKIRPTTVSKSVQELIQDNLVYEGEVKNPGKQGRPEISLRPNLDRYTAIAIYVVSLEIKGALINLGEDILAEKTITLTAGADNRVLTREISSLIHHLDEKKPAGSEMLGTGASLPGSVNLPTSTWISSCRWPLLRNLSFDAIEEKSGHKLSVHRFLDTELEFLLIKNPDYRQGGTILFHWGYGIGSAYANMGSVLRSTLGRFGEIGHWKVDDPFPRKCTCGLTGCLETKAALWALLPEIRKTYPDTPEDENEFRDFFHESGLEQLPLMEKAIESIIPALTNLYKIFFPDRILIISPFTSSKSILARLKEGLLNNIPNFARETVSLVNLDEGFQGEIYASTYSLFHNALRNALIAHWEN